MQLLELPDTKAMTRAAQYFDTPSIFMQANILSANGLLILEV
jgi:hypothetical protein